MTTEICFMAGESAERSWRYVVPFLPRDAMATYHELRGRAGAEPGYSWQDEVDGLSAALPSDRPTHLVGLSAGATLALAFVAADPARVASLSLVEPAWSFLPLTTVENDYFAQLDAILRLPATAARDGFRRLIVRADVPLPALRSDIAERERERQATGQPSALRGPGACSARTRVRSRRASTLHDSPSTAPTAEGGRAASVQDAPGRATSGGLAPEYHHRSDHRIRPMTRPGGGAAALLQRRVVERGAPAEPSGRSDRVPSRDGPRRPRIPRRGARRVASVRGPR